MGSWYNDLNNLSKKTVLLLVLEQITNFVYGLLD